MRIPGGAVNVSRSGSVSVPRKRSPGLAGLDGSSFVLARDLPHRALRPQPRHHVQFHLVAAALQREACGAAGLEAGHCRQQRLHAIGLLVAHRSDHVAGADAGLGGRAVLQHAGDDHARVGLHAEGLGQLGREVARLDADPAAAHLAFLHDALEHDLGHRHGDGEADAHAAARARIDRGVDAQQVAVDVDQRAARVAGVDGRVGLDEVLEVVDAELVAAQRRDDAAGHGLADAEGIADGQHLVAHLQFVGAAQHDHRQLVELDLEHGQVGVGIGADHLAARVAAVVERDLDLVGALDHVVVGEDVTIGAHDHAAAQAHLGLVVLVAEEEAEPGVVAARMALRRLAGVDADHRRRGFLGRGAEAAGRGHAGRGARGRLDDRHHAAQRGRAPVDPFRLERGDHEIGRQQDGHGLGEEQPGAFHEKLVKRRERAGALRGKGRGARRGGRLSLNGRRTKTAPAGRDSWRSVRRRHRPPRAGWHGAARRRDNVAMSTTRHELLHAFDLLLAPERFKDYGPNGLQVEGRTTVRKIVSGVTASRALIEAAIRAEADAIFVHHGLFWRGQDGRVTGWMKQRLALLLNRDVNLFAYHLPLDAHPELGNNAQLGLQLGLLAHPGSAGRFGEQELGFLGGLEDGETLANAKALAVHVEKVLKRPVTLVDTAHRPIKTIAWCTGGAQGYFEAAIAAGADAFITGEISEPQAHYAREMGVAFLACGHHATERYGAPAVAEHVAAQLGLQHEFIDIDNPA